MFKQVSARIAAQQQASLFEGDAEDFVLVAQDKKGQDIAPQFYVMLGDQSVSAWGDVEAAAAAAKVVADSDPFAFEGVWVGDEEGGLVRDIRPAGLVVGFGPGQCPF